MRTTVRGLRTQLEGLDPDTAIVLRVGQELGGWHREGVLVVGEIVDCLVTGGPLPLQTHEAIAVEEDLDVRPHEACVHALAISAEHAEQAHD